MTITPLERRRLSDAAVEQLLELIRSGAIPAGARLPSERDLARDLGVSRVSVRESFRVLEALGVIEVKTGIGAFVTPQSSITVQLASYFRKHSAKVLDVVEIRETLAGLAGELAAQRLTDAELDEVERLLAAQRAAHARGEQSTLADLDETFHALIYHGTRNEVLIAWQQYMQDALDNIHLNQITLTTRTDESLHEHEVIVEALRARQAKGAARALRVHARRSSAEIRKAIERLADARAQPAPERG